MGKIPILTKREVQVLEAALNWSTYKEALNMDARTFYTYLSRIRSKYNRAKKFLMRMRRYERVLFKYRYVGDEEY